MVTAPEMSRASTWRITISWIRCSRSVDSPTSSGLAVGSEAAASGSTIAGRINSRTISILPERFRSASSNIVAHCFIVGQTIAFAWSVMLR